MKFIKVRYPSWKWRQRFYLAVVGIFLVLMVIAGWHTLLKPIEENGKWIVFNFFVALLFGFFWFIDTGRSSRFDFDHDQKT